MTGLAKTMEFKMRFEDIDPHLLAVVVGFIGGAFGAFVCSFFN